MFDNRMVKRLLAGAATLLVLVGVIVLLGTQTWAMIGAGALLGLLILFTIVVNIGSLWYPWESPTTPKCDEEPQLDLFKDPIK